MHPSTLRLLYTALSRALAVAHDLDAALDVVTHAVVPALGDYCAIGDPGARHVAVLGREVKRVPGTLPPLVAEALAAPRTQVLEGDPGLGLKQVVLVPARGRDGVVAGLVVGVVDPARALDASEQLAVEDLAARVALLFENAALRLAERALEEKLLKVQKLDALGRLAGGVAHDFNNVLTVVSGYTEVLVRHLPGSSPAVGHAMHILRAAQRGTRLTRQLLAFVAQTPTEPVIVDVNEAIRRGASMLRHLVGEDITLELDLSTAPLLVRMDPAQLDQVLLNLVVNARDALPRGGRVEVRTAPAIEGGRRHVRLTVADNGVGMTEETRARIFEPFFTTKEGGKGTGLGLATVLGIVEHWGGRVTVESAPDAGTTFHVVLPEANTAGPTNHSTSSLRRLVSGGPEIILLVEDDEAVREFVEHVLKGRGYTVLSAADGLQAQELAERHQGPIDLLVSDVVLPNLSGRDLAERLLAVRPELAILHMSGYPGDSVARYGDLPGGGAFLQKPFTAQELAAKVRAVLDERLSALDS